jgi:hypothetical protein
MSIGEFRDRNVNDWDVFLSRPQRNQRVVTPISLYHTNFNTGNDSSMLAAISRDGTYVAFLSEATDLLDASDGNGSVDVFRRAPDLSLP